MREILFRGKDIISGEWITGFLVDGSHIGSWLECEPVNPATVGQFTGLTDTNGTKIFEGDIVEGADFTAEDGGYGVVSFVDGAFEVNGNNVTGTFHENYWGREFEVIGNIHDNPELLEGA